MTSSGTDVSVSDWMPARQAGLCHSCHGRGQVTLRGHIKSTAYVRHLRTHWGHVVTLCDDCAEALARQLLVRRK